MVATTYCSEHSGLPFEKNPSQKTKSFDNLFYTTS